MVFVARMLLGIFYLISGLNWFFGFMPLPSIYTPPNTPMKHAVVSEMIKTGWMFQFAKVTELCVGISLVTNRAVPALLALAAPVAFITFMLDALILDDVWRWITGVESTPAVMAAIYDMVIGGLCVFLLHIWLMLCYFDYYRPMLVWEANPRKLGLAGAGQMIRTSDNQAIGRDRLRIAFLTLGWIAIALQAWNLYLFIGLIGE